MDEFLEEFFLEAILEKLRKFSGPEFEGFLASHYMAQGYLVDQVGGAGDNGVDLIIEPSGKQFCLAATGVKSAVQAKQQEDIVRSRCVREFSGALCSKRTSQKGVKKGYFVTTSSFSDHAREAAYESPICIDLIAGDELAQMVMQHLKRELQSEIWAEIDQFREDEKRAETQRAETQDEPATVRDVTVAAPTAVKTIFSASDMLALYGARTMRKRDWLNLR